MTDNAIGNKPRRAMIFMVGLANRQVRRALAAHGFSEEDLAEGIARVQRINDARLGTKSSLDPRLVGDLDAWENRWFPIIEIVLRTNYPAVHAIVFRNLKQTEGVDLIATVNTLLNRLDLIARPVADGGMGDEGQAARALLEKRGLTERVVLEARELLASLGAVSETPDLLEPESPEAVTAAEESLWNWYLEWSGIARVAIRDRRMLRALGFLRTVKRADGTEEDVVVDDEDVDTDAPPAPVPTPTPAPFDPDPDV